MRRNLLFSCLGFVGFAAVASCADDESSAVGGGATTGSAGEGGDSLGGYSGSAPTAGKPAAGNATGAQGGEAGGKNPSGGAPVGTDGGAAGQHTEPSTAGEAGQAGETGGGGEGPVVDVNAPRLRYDFEEGAGTVVGDSSGHGADGTNADAAAWSVEGRNGAALSMNGGTPPTRFVSVPNGVFAGASAFTVAAWLKLNADPPWSRVFDFGNGGVGADTRFVYLTPASNQGIRFSVFGGTGTREATVVTNTTLPLGVWKHVAVTASNGEHYIYVDGAPAGHVASVIVPASEMEPLAPSSWLGKSRFPDGGFDGLMDEFVVYQRALAANEVADLAWPKTDYSSWRFDEAAGTIAHDSSDRAIDAELKDGAVWTSGRQNAGVQLAGTAEHVAFASNPIAGCTTSLTISTWVKLNVATQWSRIFDFGGVDNFMFLVPRDGANAMRFVMHTAAEETNLVSNTTVPVDAAWHHVAVVISPTAGTLFLDGISVANVPTPAVAPSELGELTENWLGRSRFASDAYLNASLDQLRISCRAFTDDEIKNLAFK